MKSRLDRRLLTQELLRKRARGVHRYLHHHIDLEEGRSKSLSTPRTHYRRNRFASAISSSMDGHVVFPVFFSSRVLPPDGLGAVFWKLDDYHYYRGTSL